MFRQSISKYIQGEVGFQKKNNYLPATQPFLLLRSKYIIHHGTNLAISSKTGIMPLAAVSFFFSSADIIFLVVLLARNPSFLLSLLCAYATASALFLAINERCIAQPRIIGLANKQEAGPAAPALYLSLLNVCVLPSRLRWW